MIRVELPAQLRILAKIKGEVEVEVAGPATIGAVLDAIEARYPVLEGAIRDHGTLRRRPFVRYFLCGQDWSHEPADTPLPEAVAEGREPFLVIGAIAGG
jgi:molybdopterin converting factor small subunit